METKTAVAAPPALAIATPSKTSALVVEKLTSGITGPARTDVERMIAQFDALKAEQAKRKLTTKEQRIYDSLVFHVGEKFKTVIRQIRQRQQQQQQQQQPKIQSGGGTTWQNDSIQFLWVLIQPIIGFVTSLFEGTPNSNPYTIEDLLQSFGIDIKTGDVDDNNERINGANEKLNGAISKMRDTIVAGISGAASASMDMVLNAFSMLPGIGTTLLIWRMFQNVLVILGSSVSVASKTTEVKGQVNNGGSSTGGGTTVGGGSITVNKNRQGRRGRSSSADVSITAGARAVHRSLKRFSEMAARITSTSSSARARTMRRSQMRGGLSSLSSAYARKPATASALLLPLPPSPSPSSMQSPKVRFGSPPHPFLKTVAAS